MVRSEHRTESLFSLVFKYVITIFSFLDAAIQMELWQEAYKAIEDIHGLMILSKKVFQPKMMANYYQKLALVFLKCGNQLFHAAAIFKYFQLTREMKKNISAEELGKLASRGIFQKRVKNFLK